MARKKLVNVGEVDIEEDEVTTATLDDEMNGDPSTAQEDDPVQTPEEAFDAATKPEGWDQEQEQAEEEALENISESDKEKTLKRERNALMKEVGKLGETFGSSKTCMISLAERVTEAAMSGSIKPADAEPIYDAFKRKADAKATLDDAGVVPDAAVSEKPETVDPAKSKKQQVSKVRGFIKLGNEFEEDAGTIIRTARNVHLRMIETQDRKTIKKGSTYSILVQVASEQLSKERKGAPMTEKEIEAYLTEDVADPVPPDTAKKIEDAINNARAAARGSRDGARAPYDNDNLNLAIEHLRAALGDLAPARLEELDRKHNKATTEASEAAVA